MCEECIREIMPYWLSYDRWNPDMLKIFCGSVHSIVHQVRRGQMRFNSRFTGTPELRIYCLNNKDYCLIRPRPRLNDILVKIIYNEFATSCFFHDPASNLFIEERNGAVKKTKWRQYSIKDIDHISTIINLISCVKYKFCTS